MPPQSRSVFSLIGYKKPRVTREAVILAYRFMLAREPESEEIISSHMTHPSIDSLRTAIESSDEYQERIKQISSNANCSVKLKFNSIVFMHIPKTGGTSIHNLLSKFFKNHEICPERFNRLDRYNDNELRQYKYLSGHYDWTAIERIPDKDLIFTILREPRARILSLYRFWRSHTWEAIERHDLAGPRLAKSMPLLDFLRFESGGIPGNIDNVMIRLLTGHGGEDHMPDDEALDLAKERLLSMSFFGIMEQMNETVSRLFALLDAPVPPVVPRDRDMALFSENPNMEAAEEIELTPEIEAELERLTRRDARLYAFARDVFNEADRGEGA